MNQTSIRNKVTLSGIGIHSGKTVSITLCPAPPHTGIVFIRTDYNNASIKVCSKNLRETPRATLLQENEVSIATPEHLLSACYGLNIQNLIIEISNEEVPIMDGSALPFVTALEKAIPYEQSQSCLPIQIKTPIWVQNADKTVAILPSNELKWSYCLEYTQSFIGKQSITMSGNVADYTTQIAPARTYGFKSEVDTLLAKGLAKGGSLENALIIDETDYLNTPRMPDELCRHKLLDLIGDFAIVGKPIIAHIVGIKSGHNLHMKAVQELAKQLAV